MKYLKKAIFTAVIVFYTLSYCDAQEHSEGLKHYSIEEAIELSKTKPKKMVVDVYTDWCGWCKKMDKTTYLDKTLIKQMNEDFYFVKLNAEQEETIYFKDKAFEYLPQYKANEMAVALLSGKMSYPSTVFLDEEMNLLTVVPGYLTVKDLSPILTYFGKNKHKKMKWDEFMKENEK